MEDFSHIIIKRGGGIKLNSPFSVSTIEDRPVPTVERVDKVYSVLDDPSENNFINAANDIIDIHRSSITAKEAEKMLRQMSSDELKKQQQTLADSGFYDEDLIEGRSVFGGKVQDILIRNGYLAKSGRDSIVGRNTVTALQEMLVDKGYLPEFTEIGRNNIDGLLGKRTQEAFKNFYRDYNIDGLYGNRTLNAYMRYLDEEANPYKRKVDAKGMVDECAAWVSKKFDSVVGNTKQNGVYGNAWNMLKNIENAGGNIIFNLYDSPEFNNVSTPKELKVVTEASLSKSPIDYSNLISGDIVGIYMPTSSHMNDALKTGTTYNTHVGMVIGTEDGVPIIEHNILGKTRRERIDRLTGSIGGRPIVTVAARPKNTVSVSGILPFDSSIKSDLKVEVPVYDRHGKDTGERKVIDNPQLTEYKNALASSRQVFKDIYPDVDDDFIERAAVAILGRETYFMEHKQSDYRKVFDNPGNVMDFASAWIRNATTTLLKEPEVVSRDLTKTKYSSIPNYIKVAIGLENPEQLDTDPTITGRAVYALLARNYDYFQRLAKEYPEMGLTKTDIENATLQSYNSGMGSGLGYSLGFDEDTGNIDMSEIELLRRRGTEGYKEKDPSSTNYPYITKLGDILLKNTPRISTSTYGMPFNLGYILSSLGRRMERNIPESTPYIGRARQYLEGITRD